MGSYDLYVASRASTSAPFSPPVSLVALNTSTWDSDPEISDDGLTLYYVKTPFCCSPEAIPGLDIYVASRPDTSAPFGAGVPLSEINTPDIAEFHPSLSSDELTLYFASNRSPSLGSHDIWFATRADRSLPFDPPNPLTEVNSTGTDMDPTITADGLTLYLVRTVGGDGNINVSTRPDTVSPFSSPTPVTEVNSIDHDWNPSISADGNTLYFGSRFPAALMDYEVWVAYRCGP